MGSYKARGDRITHLLWRQLCNCIEHLSIMGVTILTFYLWVTVLWSKYDTVGYGVTDKMPIIEIIG